MIGTHRGGLGGRVRRYAPSWPWLRIQASSERSQRQRSGVPASSRPPDIFRPISWPLSAATLGYMPMV